MQRALNVIACGSTGWPLLAPSAAAPRWHLQRLGRPQRRTPRPLDRSGRGRTEAAARGRAVVPCGRSQRQGDVWTAREDSSSPEQGRGESSNATALRPWTCSAERVVGAVTVSWRWSPVSMAKGAQRLNRCVHHVRRDSEGCDVGWRIARPRSQAQAAPPRSPARRRVAPTSPSPRAALVASLASILSRAVALGRGSAGGAAGCVGSERVKREGPEGPRRALRRPRPVRPRRPPRRRARRARARRVVPRRDPRPAQLLLVPEPACAPLAGTTFGQPALAEDVQVDW